MSTSGAKRARKAGGHDDDPKKKPKAATVKGEAANQSSAVAIAPVPVASVNTKSATPSRKTSPSSRPPTTTVQEDRTTLTTTPYQDPSFQLGKQTKATTAVATKMEPVLPMKIPKTDATTTTTTSIVLNGHDSYSSTKARRSRFGSIPFLLLLLVAFFLWCTVILLGLLLSERMEHQLQMSELRQIAAKVQRTGPTIMQGLQSKIQEWKSTAIKLESEKRGILQEFGEKLKSLEFSVQ